MFNTDITLCAYTKLSYQCLSGLTCINQNQLFAQIWKETVKEDTGDFRDAVFYFGTVSAFRFHMLGP